MASVSAMTRTHVSLSSPCTQRVGNKPAASKISRRIATAEAHMGHESRSSQLEMKESRFSRPKRVLSHFLLYSSRVMDPFSQTFRQPVNRHPTLSDASPSAFAS